MKIDSEKLKELIMMDIQREKELTRCYNEQLQELHKQPDTKGLYFLGIKKINESKFENIDMYERLIENSKNIIFGLESALCKIIIMENVNEIEDKEK